MTCATSLYVQAGILSGLITIALFLLLFRIMRFRVVVSERPTAGQAANLTQAMADVIAERRRQVEAEGWTPEHDDQHRQGELARASAAYISYGASFTVPAGLWPWSGKWWKPTGSKRRALVKGVALGLAEIERLDRAKSQVKPTACKTSSPPAGWRLAPAEPPNYVADAMVRALSERGVTDADCIDTAYAYIAAMAAIKEAHQ